MESKIYQKQNKRAMGPIINDVTQIGGGVSYFLTVQKIKGMGVRGGSKNYKLL